MAYRKNERSSPHFITQIELARRAGVSRSTVAAVLNPNSKIILRQATRDKVLSIAKQFNYQPQRHARIMRGGRSGLIGILTAEGNSDVHYERMKRLATKFRAAGFDLIVCSPDWYEDGIHGAVRYFLSAMVEGIVIESYSPAPGQISALREAGIPIVILSADACKGVPSVLCDAEQGVFDVVNHLISLGHRNLAFASSTRLLPMRDAHIHDVQFGRIRGFCKAIVKRGGSMENADLSFLNLGSHSSPARKNPGLRGDILTVPRIPDSSSYSNGRRAMEMLLQRNKKADALVCTNDEWAIGAIAAALRRNLKVPDDIAITGFDDAHIAEVSPVPLTTLAQPVSAMTDKAAEILLNTINLKGKREPNLIIRLPCKLVIRESCGAV